MIHSGLFIKIKHKDLTYDLISLFPNTAYKITLEGFYPNGLSTRPASLEIATVSITDLPHLVVSSMPRSTRIKLNFGIEKNSDGEFPTLVKIELFDASDNFLNDFDMTMFPKSDSPCNGDCTIPCNLGGFQGQVCNPASVVIGESRDLDHAIEPNTIYKVKISMTFGQKGLISYSEAIKTAPPPPKVIYEHCGDTYVDIAFDWPAFLANGGSGSFEKAIASITGSTSGDTEQMFGKNAGQIDDETGHRVYNLVDLFAPENNYRIEISWTFINGISRTTDEIIFSGITGKTLFDFDMIELNSIGVVLTWTNDDDVKSYESRFINDLGFGFTI